MALAQSSLSPHPTNPTRMRNTYNSKELPATERDTLHNNFLQMKRLLCSYDIRCDTLDNLEDDIGKLVKIRDRAKKNIEAIDNSNSNRIKQTELVPSVLEQMVLEVEAIKGFLSTNNLRCDSLTNLENNVVQLVKVTSDYTSDPGVISEKSNSSSEQDDINNSTSLSKWPTYSWPHEQQKPDVSYYGPLLCSAATVHNGRKRKASNNTDHSSYNYENYASHNYNRTGPNYDDHSTQGNYSKLTQQQPIMSPANYSKLTQQQPIMSPAEKIAIKAAAIYAQKCTKETRAKTKSNKRKLYTINVSTLSIGVIYESFSACKKDNHLADRKLSNLIERKRPWEGKIFVDAIDVDRLLREMRDAVESRRMECLSNSSVEQQSFSSPTKQQQSSPFTDQQRILLKEDEKIGMKAAAIYAQLDKIEYII